MVSIPEPWQGKAKRLILFFLIAFVAIETVVLVTFPTRNLMIAVLDVGQGDAIALQTAEGHRILIDGGPDDSVLPELGQLFPFWVQELDLLVITHWDSDHITGLLDILERYRVRHVLVGTLECETAVCEAVLSAIEEEDAEILLARQEASINLGKTSFSVLWPPHNCSLGRNDCSVVLLLNYGDFEAVFTGDIEEAGQKNFLGLVRESEVFKVPHHGADCLWEPFLQRIKPMLSVVSVGENSVGHPKPETLNKLHSVGTKILRTDQVGTVKVISDGGRWGIRN
ncbi:MAG: MBL fold metallo-hydrolase [Patescibacteria group bacterium]|nr:MBL fold metallo-hydrolase [Patescibacteria group bacterium]